MPKGTRVHKCVTKVKAAGDTGVNPYAVCQDATRQSYATGKPVPGAPRRKRDKPPKR